MVSLRFPFSFSQPPKHPLPRSSPSALSFAVATAASVAAGAAAVAAAGIAASRDTRRPFLENALDFLVSRSSSLPLWCSLSLAENSPPVVESKTGASFPSVIGGSRQLLGVGLRRKSVLGLKNIDVYAFGVYADDKDVSKLLKEKYGKLSISELKESKEVSEDLMESDICLTVRLQIVYGKLSIKSVRSAFEESVGNRLKKFSPEDNKELLQRFTSQFKDEYKIPRGSVIDLSRDRGHVLRTTIDGNEVGSIESKLLCRSILDLYIGEDPFDRQAREDVKLNLASLLQK
ncbi:fatty-acid-binding protein 1 [Rhodamnia argentea]|uniref:Fatty-acid-binding protein 1 n=1 Tax=Rhodamnia argentea TaxID=178133 RepID=A0A8B8QFG6_9MYRT|nr:fatty-acid-binding protein 1 [Rhodamnia argentea]